MRQRSERIGGSSAMSELEMQEREALFLADSDMENSESFGDMDQEDGDEWKTIDTKNRNSSSVSLASAPSASNSDEAFFNINVGKYKEEMRRRKISSEARRVRRHIVDSVERIYLPRRFSSYLPVSTNDSDASNGFIHPHGKIPLIQGLNQVLDGSKPASECVQVCGLRPIRYLWYGLSGFMCDIIQFFIDMCLLHIFNITDASVCWALGFGLSIVIRHTSHRYLVFGDYVGGYWKSLMRMYTGYSIIIVISTLFNIFMTKILKVSHYTAWIVTLLWTGIVNYFILKKIWSFGGDTKLKTSSLSRKKGSSHGSSNGSSNSMQQINANVDEAQNEP